LLILVLLVSFQAFAQTPLPAGYPDRSASLDVLPGFIHPPKDYVEVPFYCWQGDTLTCERLYWQLNQRQSKGIPVSHFNFNHLNYNTLANNYTTILTRYRGSIRSGLIGPGNINVNQ